jgi:hypothetical protein
MKIRTSKVENQNIESQKFVKGSFESDLFGEVFGVLIFGVLTPSQNKNPNQQKAMQIRNVFFRSI